MGLVVGLAMIAARHPLVSLFAVGDNLSATTISTTDLLLAGILLPQHLFCRWLKPVTEEGRAGLKAYREEA